MPKETLPVRSIADKIGPCCKRCLSLARRKTRLCFVKRIWPPTASCCRRLLDDKFAALYRAGKNSRRRLSRTRPGSLERGGRCRVAEKKATCSRRSSVTRPGGWPSANHPGRRAHLSRLGARPDARPRRQRPSRQAAGRLSADDQPSWRDDFRRERHFVGAPVQKDSGTVGAACIGDGATSTGAFHEALNQAAVEKLPLVLVVADNQYAYSTPTTRQFACRDLADKAAGYGVEVQSLDGTDLAACLKPWAVGRARAPAAARSWSSPRCSGFAATANTTTPATLIPKLKASPSDATA
jgi:hypothetical protein